MRFCGVLEPISVGTPPRRRKGIAEGRLTGEPAKTSFDGITALHVHCDHATRELSPCRLHYSMTGTFKWQSRHCVNNNDPNGALFRLASR